MALARFGTWGSILWITVDHQLDLDKVHHHVWPAGQFYHQGPLACSSKTSPARSSQRRCSSPGKLSVLIFFQFSTISWLTFRILATGSNTWKVFVECHFLTSFFWGLAPNFTKFHFDVAHPKILDDGSDDHPCPTTASSTVHQAVSTLRMVGNVGNKIIGKETVWKLGWDVTQHISNVVFYTRDNTWERWYVRSKMFFTRSPLRVRDVLYGMEKGSENEIDKKRGTYEVGIWKSGMARL